MEGALSRAASGSGDEAGWSYWRTVQRQGFSAVVLTVVVASLPGFLVGTLAVEVRHSLHFGATALGLSIAVFNLGAAVSSVPVGRLVERVGGIRVMRLAMVVAAVLFGLVGLASSWAVLTLLLLATGMLSGGMNPAANLFLARAATPERHGLIFGIKQAAVPLASLLGGIAVPAIALTVGWRWAFGLAAVLAVLTAATLPVARREPVRPAGQSVSRPSVQVVTAPLVILTLGLCLGVIASSGCLAFLVSAATKLGIANGTAGLVAAAAAGAATAVRVGVGAAADRREGGHFQVVAAMVGIGVLGYLALAAGTAGHSHLLFVAGAVVGLGVGWGWNGLFTFAIVRSHPAAPAAATGVTQVGGRVGGMLGPATIGVIAGHASYTLAWLVAGGTGVLAALTMVVGYRMLARAPALGRGALADLEAQVLPIVRP